MKDWEGVVVAGLGGYRGAGERTGKKGVVAGSGGIDVGSARLRFCATFWVNLLDRRTFVW